MSPKSDADLEDLVQSFIDSTTGQPDYKVYPVFCFVRLILPSHTEIPQGFDSAFTPHLKLLSATLDSKPTVEFSFTVRPQHANRGGNFHGGAIATLFDNTTTMALLLPQKEGIFRLGGVSRSLNCVYLRPAPIGTEVRLRVEAEGMGKRMGMWASALTLLVS